jgi:hypothetical protein
MAVRLIWGEAEGITSPVERRLPWLLGSLLVAVCSQLMDILKMLAELRQERDQVDEAIAVLQRIAYGRGKRHGRPPVWMSAVKRRGRPPGTKNKPKEG